MGKGVGMKRIGPYLERMSEHLGGPSRTIVDKARAAVRMHIRARKLTITDDKIRHITFAVVMKRLPWSTTSVLGSILGYNNPKLAHNMVLKLRGCSWWDASIDSLIIDAAATLPQVKSKEAA